MSKKALTIKEVSEDNLAYFHIIKGDLNQNQAFEKLIDLAKNSSPNNEVFETKIADLKSTIDSLQIDIQVKTEDCAILWKETEAKTLEIEALKVEIQNLKETARESSLQGAQFICNPSEETFEMARKARSFIRKEGDFDFTNENYPDALANHSIKYYLTENYSHIINK